MILPPWYYISVILLGIIPRVCTLDYTISYDKFCGPFIIDRAVCSYNSYHYKVHICYNSHCSCTYVDRLCIIMMVCMLSLNKWLSLALVRRTMSMDVAYTRYVIAGH